MKANLGLKRFGLCLGKYWVIGYIRLGRVGCGRKAGYIRVQDVVPVFFICDEKEEPRGAMVVPRVLLIVIKTQVALSPAC